MSITYYWNNKLDPEYHTHMWTNRICLEKITAIGVKKPIYIFLVKKPYDNEVDNDKRFFMILDEIKRLCSMTKEEIHKWYYEMEDILIYNQDHFANYKKQDHVNIWNEISEIING